jgi:hypothetical protein
MADIQAFCQRQGPRYVRKRYRFGKEQHALSITNHLSLLFSTCSRSSCRTRSAMETFLDIQIYRYPILKAV